MKKLLGILTIVLAFGFVSDKPVYDKPRKQPKLKWETPPGMVWLRDSTFIDKTEIRNLDYLEFLHWTGRNEPEKYTSLLPDSLCFRDSLRYGEPYVLHYLRHPAYYSYPVVGVSYEQAVAFSEWRARMINRFIYIRENKIKSDNWDTIVGFPVVMTCRLPTKAEWEYASAAGLPYDNYPLGHRNLFGEDSFAVSKTQEFGYSYRLSTKRIFRRHVVYSDDDRSPVDWGKPNEYGVYNLLGNVSELVADSLVKGLNYLTGFDGKTFREKRNDFVLVDSTANAYDYNYTFRYTKPQPWLGFRCVCVVQKRYK